MNDNTRFQWSVSGKIALPHKMTKAFITELRKKHPEPLAIKDSATYEYTVRNGKGG